MQATLFEFRYRWWIFGALFGIAFLAYAIDHAPSSVAFVDWLSRQLGFKATDNSYRVMFASGTVLLLLAATMRTWGTAYLDADVMRDSRVHSERLLADGPYRYVRNPLYFGNIVMAVGLGLMASRVGFVILIVGMTLFVLRLLFREEAELSLGQDEAYRRYCAAVPRLIPSLTPRVPTAGEQAHWGPAFRAELMYWLLALALAAFTITLNIKYFWAIFAVAMTSAFLLKAPENNSETSVPEKQPIK
jgi:protein-S-isoprenylcysteine O-methyltransferase Ste14